MFQPRNGPFGSAGFEHPCREAVEVIPLVRIGVPATERSLNLELFRGYELAPGSYDEVFASRGVLATRVDNVPHEPPAELAGANTSAVGSRPSDCYVKTVSPIPISAIRRHAGARGSWTGCR